MAVDKRIRAALDMSHLNLPPIPRVDRLEAEDYTDSMGEPSLRVLVVLGETTSVDDLSGPAIRALKSAIVKSLRQHGVTLFPYIFLAKESELQEAASEG